MTTHILSAKEAADYLGLTLNTIYSFSSRGVLPKLKYSGKLKFLKEDLDNFILGNRIESVNCRIS